jgi:methyltransferase (TIGR00027 family)
MPAVARASKNMDAARAKENVAKTAHLTAWARTLGRLSEGQAAANGDYLADCFLLPYQRWFNRLPRATRWLFERASPGAYGYFNARTCYFDEVLEREAEAGLTQLVLLGAGFDSRPLRFAKQLGRTRVFEVDMPEVLKLRAQRLRNVAVDSAPCVAVPIDFERDDLSQRLVQQGFSAGAGRTLVLWEGVTYYLPPAAVDAVLANLAKLCAPGSSVVFDYVTQAFFDGDHGGYGAKMLAEGWRRLGNVHRSGVGDVAALLRPHGFSLRAELSPAELERRYLSALPGAPSPWGVMRIAHAVLD